MRQSEACRPGTSTRRNSTQSERYSRDGSITSNQITGPSTSRRSTTSSSACESLAYPMSFYVDFLSHMPGNRSLSAIGVVTDPRNTFNDNGIDTFSGREFDLKELLQASFERKEADELRVKLARMSRRVWDISIDPKKTSEEQESARNQLDKYTTSHFEIQVSPALCWSYERSKFVPLHGMYDFRLVKKVAASAHERPGLSQSRSPSLANLARPRSSVSTASPGTASRRQSVILEDSRHLRTIAHGGA